MSDRQKMLSDLLRSADKEIKNAKYEDAMRYINKIVEIDVKNVYAKAYKERIISLMEAQGIPRQEAERIATEAKLQGMPKPVVDETPVVKKEEPVPTPVQHTPPKQEPVPQPKIEIPKSPQPDAPPAPQHVKKSSPPVPQKGQQTIKRTAAAQEAYRSLLMEIWKDGSISDEEQSRIDSMRETFAITHEEHSHIEVDVRMSCYMNAIRDEWRKGITNFETIRKRFRISDQEQITLEPKVFQLIQSLQANGSVLVLDDDEAFLAVIKNMLNEAGFYCFTSVSGEDGLRVLDTMTPDIVLCDINFSKPHMSGFAFYERFRSMDRFLTTPFIFLSALDQDVLIRTGKKLGADDYLTKPIDTEMLLATIEGKMRRSRELRRTIE
ncbi:MAG: response regulator [Ignavibacteriales bacterium]|nr:response regulator [Ignavibacteriales bacterium]